VTDNSLFVDMWCREVTCSREVPKVMSNVSGLGDISINQMKMKNKSQKSKAFLNTQPLQICNGKFLAVKLMCFEGCRHPHHVELSKNAKILDQQINWEFSKLQILARTTLNVILNLPIFLLSVGLLSFEWLNLSLWKMDFFPFASCTTNWICRRIGKNFNNR